MRPSTPCLAAPLPQLPGADFARQPIDSGALRRRARAPNAPLTGPGPPLRHDCNSRQSSSGSHAMRLKFLGTNSDNGQCPTLYETDRDTYVVQGWVVTDPDALHDLRDVLAGETFVEIPRELIKFARPEDRT